MSSSFKDVGSAMAGIRKLVAEFASQPLARPPSSGQPSFGGTPSHSFPEWLPTEETLRSWQSAAARQRGGSGDELGATCTIHEPEGGSAMASCEVNMSMVVEQRPLEDGGAVEAPAAAAAAQTAGRTATNPTETTVVSESVNARLGALASAQAAAGRAGVAEAGDDFGARSFFTSEGEVFSIPLSMSHAPMEVEDYISRQASYLSTHEVT